MTLVQYDNVKMKQYYVYILANKSKTIYIGITNNLVRRVYEHKNKMIEGFTKKYNLTKLVYFEIFNEAKDAIKREKQLKNWHRQWKINLIESMNKDWRDLSSETFKDAEINSA